MYAEAHKSGISRMNNIYCVRQKSTGYFIPRIKVGNFKGGSYSEPEKDCVPRIFYSKTAAQSFINVWVKGIHKDYSIKFDGEYEHTIKIEKQDHRNKNDMEIIEFKMIEI